MSILIGASLIRSCCMSVFTATNSTWFTPASSIRLIAFRPAPPTPTTRMTARYEAVGAPVAWCRRGAGSGVASRVALRRLAAGGGGSGTGGPGSGSGSGTGSGLGGAGSSMCSTVCSGGSAAASVSGAASPPSRCCDSVRRKSSASGPSRMLARFRAIEHLLGEVAVERRGLAGRIVGQHRLAPDRSLRKADRLADAGVEDEVAEVLVQDLHRLARVQRAAVEHGREDPVDPDVRIQ